LASPFSIEMWCYPLSRRQGASQQLLTCDNGVQPLCDLMYLGTGVFRFNCGNNALTSATAHPIQHWYHVVGTYGNATGPKLYVNSILEASGAAQGALAPTSIFSLGLSSGNVGASVLTECAFYSTELSASRVSAHFLAQEVTGGPVFQLPGSAGSGGGVSLNSAQLAAILAAVQKTFPAT